jgi:hypothetical protein
MDFEIDVKAIDRLSKELSKLKRPLDRTTARMMGSTLVSEMKSDISKGISTVRGGGLGGRMPPYKNPSKYPGDRKRARPVNLKLTGAQLNELDFDVFEDREGFSVEVGYFSNAGKAQDKEEGHARGVFGQPRRPTIPQTGRNQTFNKRLTAIILEILQKRFSKLIRRINGRT